jgi:hypothetical protein
VAKVIPKQANAEIKACRAYFAVAYRRQRVKKIHRFLSLVAMSLIYGKDLQRQKEVGKEHKRKHNNYSIFFDGEINGASKNTDTKRD